MCFNKPFNMLKLEKPDSGMGVLQKLQVVLFQGERGGGTALGKNALTMCKSWVRDGKVWRLSVIGWMPQNADSGMEFSN